MRIFYNHGKYNNKFDGIEIVLWIFFSKRKEEEFHFYTLEKVIKQNKIQIIKNSTTKCFAFISTT